MGNDMLTGVVDLTFTKKTPLDWVTGVNNATSGIFGVFLLILATFIPIVYILRREENVAKALIYGGFSGAIVGGLLVFAGLLTWQITMIPIGLLMIGLITRIFS